MARQSPLNKRNESITGAVCVMISLTLLLLPDSIQIVVAHGLARVLVNPWLEIRNFGEDILRVRQQNALLAAQVQMLQFQLAGEQRGKTDRARQAGLALEGDFDSSLPMAPCLVTARKRARLATMIHVRSLEPLDWRSGMPVITPLGFLGRIHTISCNRSAWVELLSAPEMALGVEFERTGLLGVLRPRASRLVVELVGRDEDVQQGDLVVTAGISEVRDAPGSRPKDPAPRGLRVGVVEYVDAPSAEIFKEIVVQPLADFRYNETVFVVGAKPLAARSEQDVP